VERCAFERANLMIGATDIVVMAQRVSQTPHEAMSPRQRKGIRRRRIVSTERSAEADRPSR
jgi:hypothetical protein